MELLTHAQTVVPGAPLRFFGVPGNEATHTDAIVTAVTSIFIPYTGVATHASIILSGQREKRVCTYSTGQTLKTLLCNAVKWSSSKNDILDPGLSYDYTIHESETPLILHQPTQDEIIWRPKYQTTYPTTICSYLVQGWRNRGARGAIAPPKLHCGAQLCALCATFGSVQVLQPPNLILLPPPLT